MLFLPGFPGFLQNVFVFHILHLIYVLKNNKAFHLFYTLIDISSLVRFTYDSLTNTYNNSA